MAGRRSDLRRLRRECAQLLDRLDLPARADLAGLCAHLARARGRPLHVVPVAMQASQPCGLWLSADDADWVFYDADTGRAHQEHIILHEIGHLICGHSGGDDLPVAALFPDLDPELVRAMLARATYSDEQEQQAEVMAYLLGEVLRAPSAGGDDVASRIADSLNHSAHREP